MVYIADKLSFNVLDGVHVDTSLAVDDIKAVWLELVPPITKKILFGIFYRLHQFDAAIFINSLEKTLIYFTKEGNETILLGNFNFDYLPSKVSKMTKNFNARLSCIV